MVRIPGTRLSALSRELEKRLESVRASREAAGKELAEFEKLRAESLWGAASDVVSVLAEERAASEEIAKIEAATRAAAGEIEALRRDKGEAEAAARSLEAEIADEAAVAEVFRAARRDIEALGDEEDALLELLDELRALRGDPEELRRRSESLQAEAAWNLLAALAPSARPLEFAEAAAAHARLARFLAGDPISGEGPAPEGWDLPEEEEPAEDSGDASAPTNAVIALQGGDAELTGVEGGVETSPRRESLGDIWTSPEPLAPRLARRARLGRALRARRPLSASSGGRVYSKHAGSARCGRRLSEVEAMNPSAALAACALAISASGELRFRHHFVDRDLPGSGWGQTALADLDGDGDLDFVTGRSGGEIRWYEFVRGEGWTVHLLGERSPSEVGGAVLDVDGDGRLDFVAGGAWYRAPPDPRAGPWQRIVFDERLGGVHDVVLADLDGDGRKDAITMSDSNDLRWYAIPKDPAGPWPHRRIADAVHAGISAGDLDGDGDADVVRSDVWFENLGGGKRWEERRFCGIPWADRKDTGFTYRATRSCVADVDADGRMDIVLTEAEFSGARIAWFEPPKDPRGGPWKPHILPHADGEKRGPYHTLQVADFDLDGDLDIFAGEMERFGVPPHRWFVWENRKGEFVEHPILAKELGTHEAVAGDVDGDGDIDIVGKLWMPVPGNGNEGRNHVDYLENLLR